MNCVSLKICKYLLDSLILGHETELRASLNVYADGGGIHSFYSVNEQKSIKSAWIEL